jgi:hypothetical protein
MSNNETVSITYESNDNSSIDDKSIPPVRKRDDRPIKERSHIEIEPGSRIYGRIDIPDEMNMVRKQFSHGPSVLTREDLFDSPKMEKWRKSHEEYIHRDKRTLATVLGYTYVGDRLVNAYLRGVSPDYKHYMSQLTSSEGDLPFAYQLYDHYDFLKKHGLPMPEKDILMKDGELDMKVLKAFFDKYYEKFNTPFVMNRIIKSYADDLHEIIKNAPRFGNTLNTYRGVKNEDFLEAGALSYINRSFSSSSLSNTEAAKFTNPYGKYKCCMYNIKIDKSVSVLCIDSVSKYPKELEVLISNNVMVRYFVDVKHREVPGQGYILQRHIDIIPVPKNYKPVYLKITPKYKKKLKRSDYIKVNNSAYTKTRKRKGKGKDKGKRPLDELD